MVGSGILKQKELAKLRDVGLHTQKWSQIIQNYLSGGVGLTSVTECRYGV